MMMIGDRAAEEVCAAKHFPARWLTRHSDAVLPTLGGWHVPEGKRD